MTKATGLRLFTAPILAAALASPLLVGCEAAEDAADGEDNGGGLPGVSCAAKLKAKANAFEASVDGLVKAAGEMRGQLAVACAAIMKLSIPN